MAGCMKRFDHFRLLLIMLCLIGIAFLALPPQALGRQEMIDRIVARVNEKIITQREYDIQKEKLRDELSQHYSGQELEQQYQAAVKDLLSNMISQDLLVQKAQDLNINVDAQVVERLDQIRKQMGLASITPDLEEAVEKQGLIWEDFQNNIRRELLTQEVINREVASRIIVTTADEKKYFNEHKQQFASQGGVDLAEIQVSTSRWGPVVAQQRAKAALAMIQNGAKWDDVVKKYSDGPNVDQGGETGFFPSGSLLPEISNAIKGLDPGDTSNIVDVPSGFLLVKVMQERSAGKPQFQEVADQVANVLYQQKMQPALHDYLATLRTESYIRLEPGFIDTEFPKTGANGLPSEGE
jgi:peptidyl-prolyl cis-trans isomerase SurA